MDDNKLKDVMEHTVLVRPPQQALATFGDSVIDYWVVTELAGSVCVVRDGRVLAQKPRIITPSYLVNLEGFSSAARQYVETLRREHPHEPGVFYKYKNEFRNMEVVSEGVSQVIDNLNARLDEQHNPLSTIIRGEEETWDVSLMVFIYHLTRASLHTNVAEFRSRGFLDIDSRGVPRGAQQHLEEMFEWVSRDLKLAPQLVAELNRWGLFADYQDRFFALFHER